MEIKVRKSGRVSILELRGKLNLDNAPAMRAVVYRELDAGASGLVLDLGSVTFIDSSGLGSLAAALTSVRGRGGSLKLVRPSPKVLDVLKITGTDQHFEIFEEETEAIRSFDGSPRSGTGPQ